MTNEEAFKIRQMVENNVLACITDIVEEHDMYEEFEWTGDEMPEILECWIVTPFYGELLYTQGEPVIKRSLGYIWGRQTSGQAIYLDIVSENIAREMHVI